MDAEALMRVAIEQARSAILAGQTPVGCAIALADKVVAANHNRVLETTDITAHAEMVTIREACTRLGRIHLEGAIVASTLEPCPMCMAALHWARVDTVYYGATIADSAAVGFNELHISAADVIRLGGSPIKLAGGILAKECLAIFEQLGTGRPPATY
jgi:tRNA(Arg) A34 adenosine deaminase TadA